MAPARPVWEEGMALAPQHFQAQRRWLEEEATRALDAVVPFAWGLSGVELDAEALRGGTLALLHVRGRFPDGTPLQAPDPDPLPPPSPLAARFSPTREAHVVHVALAPWHDDAPNVTTNGSGATRFRRAERTMVDETTGGDALPVAVAMKNLRLVLDEELAAGDVALPIARIRRDAGGQFVIDRDYVPPCVQYGASPRLVELVQRTVSMLEAKSAALAASIAGSGQPAAQAYVGNEVAIRWILHAVRSAEAPLRHLLAARTAHPEKLWLELSRLAGALCTFSLTVQARDLPVYVHEDLEGCFGAIETHLHAHLDAVIAARAVVVRLQPTAPTLHSATIADLRCFEPGARWYLGVRTSLGPLETATRVPQHGKLCAAKFVLELVKRAFAGLTLAHLPTPPAAIAPRAEMTYFSVTLDGPCAQALLQSREIGMYVPDTLPDAVIEVAVLVPE
ncbi:MAG: type VI secretion system baseplate subunit TssK [Gemmatimonadaceae bacterium]|nr:type VI secretion system baseplate subunit TssK [Gemmatimonadaceae bacterium]